MDDYRVVRELLTGQITFWQAAAQFRQINRTPDGAPPASLPTHGPRPRSIPADGEDERNCMQVLLYIDASFDLDPDVRRAAIERFEAMFLNQASAGIPLSAEAR